MGATLFTVFNLDLGNIFVYFFLKLISFGVIPLTLCFSWVWLWRDSDNPFTFLSQWNSGTHILFLLMNILRIRVSKMGMTGVTYLVLSTILVALYLTDWSHTKMGSFLTGGFILLNVLFSFSLVMTTFEFIHPYFLSSGFRMQTLGAFITEMTVMGTLLTASSQLYWHEILEKRLETMRYEQIVQAMESEED